MKVILHFVKMLDSSDSEWMFVEKEVICLKPIKSHVNMD